MRKSTLRAIELLRKKNKIDIELQHQDLVEGQNKLSHQQQMLAALDEIKNRTIDPQDLEMIINASKLSTVIDHLSIHQRQEIGISQAVVNHHENELQQLNRQEHCLGLLHDKIMDEVASERSKEEQKQIDQLISSRFKNTD